MSKLGCICGNTIIDQSDNIPYKSIFVRDQDWEDYYDWTTDVDAFINAVKNGQRDSWIKSYFSETYPADINDSSVVFDIIRKSRKVEGTMYQCEQCGRLKIQVRDTDFYASFKPEDDRYKDIFKGLSNT